LLKADDIHITNESISYFKKNIDSITDKMGMVAGPILILTQNYKKDAQYLRFLPRLLPPPNNENWEIYSA
jgi:hypothetical protein